MEIVRFFLGGGGAISLTLKGLMVKFLLFGIFL